MAVGVAEDYRAIDHRHGGLRDMGGFILTRINKHKFRITDKTSDQNAIYALFEGHHERINTTTWRAI